MKPKIAFVMALMGWTTCGLGQQIVLDNLFNTGSSSATSGGLVYESLGPDPGSTLYPYTLFDGLHYNLGVTVWGGSSLGTMALMGTYTPANDPKGYTGIGPGTFALGSGVAVTVPGVGPAQTAWIELQIWDYNDPYATGTFQSYAAAAAGMDPIAEVIFQNPTASGPGAPDLTGMPSVAFVDIPEPTMLVLAGLGLALLLVLRRRSYAVGTPRRGVRGADIPAECPYL